MSRELPVVLRQTHAGMLIGCALGFTALGYVAVHPGSVPPGALWWLSHLLAGLWLCAGARIAWREGWNRPVSAEAAPPPAPGARLRAWLASSDGRFVLVLLALSALMRFAELERMPWGFAGIHIDAAYNAEVSFRILDGQQFFSAVIPSIAYYRDALIHYYLLPFFALLGRGIGPLRLAMNVLALVDILLLFLILRRYTARRFVVYGCTAFYGLWGSDVIFGMSGVEYVMVTPFLLGSFYLLLRTLKSGSRRSAVICGLVWGLGFSSHYSYLGLALALPAVIAASPRGSRGWLRSFVPGAIWGVLPKAGYLLFGSPAYFQRFADVFRHDDSGRILVASALWGNVTRLWNLLFVDQGYDKWYLPGSRMLPALAWPLLFLGVLLALRRLRQPHHCFAVTVSGVVLAANLATYPMDYRWMNWIPVMAILLAAAAEAIRQAAPRRGAWMLLWWFAIGGLLIRSAADYFNGRAEAHVMEHYGCIETAQTRAIVGGQPSRHIYILAPRLTYRTAFFDGGRQEVLEANFELDPQMQVSRSPAGEQIVIRNIQRIVEKRRAASDPEIVHLWVSQESPYRDLVADYLRQHFQVKSTEHRFEEPVSGKTLAFTQHSFFVP